MKEELTSLDIGSKIRNLPTKREMTLQDLAKLTGLSKVFGIPKNNARR